MVTKKKSVSKKKPKKRGAPSRPTGRAPANKTIAPATDKIFKEKVAKEKKKEENRKAKGLGPTKEIPGMISIEKYNAMYQAYTERQSISHVAKVCSVNATTAKKYVEKGDPKRNLRPLKDRYSSVIVNAQQKQDYTLATLRGEVLAASRVFLHRVAMRIKTLDPDDLSPDAIGKHLKDIQVTAERCLGVSDATITVKQESRYADWSEEELLNFFKTGVTPEHDRSVAPISSAQMSSKE
jgi:hypothetical protein